MSLTGSMKTTAAAGAALLAGGLLAATHGVIYNELPRVVGGTCLIVTALTAISLVSIRRWITDTSEERRDLAQSRREADATQHKYIAAQADLESEMTRLNRDMNTERRRIAATLIAERQAMLAAFEKNKLQIQTEAFRTGVEMERAGMLGPDEPAATTANLIPFPQQQPEHERSREHGVVQP